MGDFYNRDKMWFGTENYQTWIETPQSGADVSPTGHGTSGTNLQGGGFVRNSWDSHKTFQFSWGDSADLALASLIHSFRNGTYGRGLLYFHDPMYYGQNILPARWADPSMAVNYEAQPLIRGVWPRATFTGANPHRLPVQTAVYDVPAGYTSEAADDELYIPIPPGFGLWVGAVHTSSSPSAGIYLRMLSGVSALPTTATSAPQLLPFYVPPGTAPWARLGLRNSGVSTHTLSIAGMIARLVPPGEIVDQGGPWVAGQGHSGCEFRGSPTLINYNGVNGGQVGLACTLEETGAWK